MGPLRGQDPPVITRRAFHPALSSVGEARAFVVGAMAGLGAEMADSARLLTSELVTNAVVHAGCGIEVTARRSAAQVRVEVADGDARPPVPIAAAPLSPGGRGLELVAAVADAWGYERRDRGKVVWFELIDPASCRVGPDDPAPPAGWLEQMQATVRADRKSLTAKRWCGRHHPWDQRSDR